MTDGRSQLGILPKVLGKAVGAYWRWLRRLSMPGMVVAVCVTLVGIVIALGALPFGIDTSGLQRLAGFLGLAALLLVVVGGVIRGR